MIKGWWVPRGHGEFRGAEENFKEHQGNLIKRTFYHNWRDFSWNYINFIINMKCRFEGGMPTNTRKLVGMPTYWWACPPHAHLHPKIGWHAHLRQNTYLNGNRFESSCKGLFVLHRCILMLKCRLIVRISLYPRDLIWLRSLRSFTYGAVHKLRHAKIGNFLDPPTPSSRFVTIFSIF